MIICLALIHCVSDLADKYPVIMNRLCPLQDVFTLFLLSG